MHIDSLFWSSLPRVFCKQNILIWNHAEGRILRVLHGHTKSVVSLHAGEHHPFLKSNTLRRLTVQANTQMEAKNIGGYVGSITVLRQKRSNQVSSTTPRTTTTNNNRR